jgi:hypothetical protein
MMSMAPQVTGEAGKPELGNIFAFPSTKVIQTLGVYIYAARQRC